MHKAKGFLYLLTTAIVYSSFGIFVRLLEADLNGFQQLVYVSYFVILFLFLLSVTFRFAVPILTVHKGHFLTYSILYGMNGAFFTFAVLNTTITAAIFALYFSSFIASFFVSRFFFHEGISRQKVISLFLAFLGLAVFTFPISAASFNAGFLFGIAAGFIDTLANSASKYMKDSMPTTTLIFARMVGGLLFSIVFLTVTGQKVVPVTSVSVLTLSMLYALLVLIVSYAVVKGFQNFDLNLGTIIISSELVFATIFAVLFFQEYPTLTQIAGAVLIFSAIIAANLVRPRKAPTVARRKKRR